MAACSRPTRSARRRSPAAARPSRRPTRRSRGTRRSTAPRATSWSTTTASRVRSTSLADQLGPSILAVVLAHEFGHVVQTRAGELDRGLPTITTEQQADCFAGAWVARAARGEANGISFTDADVRTGLIGDDRRARPARHRPARRRRPRLGVRPRRRVPGRLHRGPDRCASCSTSRCRSSTTPISSNRDGNAPFGYDEGEIVPLIVDDLNVFWPQLLSTVGATLPPLESCPSVTTARSSATTRPATTAPGSSTARRRSGVLRRVTRPRPVRPLRRLRRRLPARRGVERGGPARPRQPARRARSGPRQRLPHRRVGRRPHPDGEVGRTRGTVDRVRATSTRRSRRRWSSATRPPTTTSSAAVSRRSPASAKVCSVASTPAPSASATDGDPRALWPRSTSAPTASTSSSPGRRATVASRR